MAEKPKSNAPLIKWREADIKKLRTAVRVFNTKRTKLIKQVPELADILPEKANVQGLKESIATRKDFNRVISRLKRFMKKGAEDVVTTKQGVVTTKYQIKEIQIAKAVINRKRSQELKRLKPSPEKGTMKTEQEANLQKKQFDYHKIKRANWEQFVKTLEVQAMDKYDIAKMRRYKENYIKALENVFDGRYQDILNQIKEIIKDIPDPIFYDLYFADADLQIDYIYSYDELEFKARSILATWKIYSGMKLSESELKYFEEYVPENPDMIPFVPPN